jgi:tRNA threonylcarbamoyl adenosine modification protein YjeE
MDNQYSLTLSEDQLDGFARFLSLLFRPGDWIFLDGDLGSGKTTFVKALWNQWLPYLHQDPLNSPSSPTFSLLQIFEMPRNIREEYGISKMLHLDLYRVLKSEELLFLGLEEEYDPRDTLVFVEWPYQNIALSDWISFFYKMNIDYPKTYEISIRCCQQSNRSYAIQPISWNSL